MTAHILQKNLYEKADELDGIRTNMEATLAKVHRKMLEMGSSYSFSAVNNFRISPSEKLLSQIAQALDALALDALASEREEREEGVFTTSEEV